VVGAWDGDRSGFLMLLLLLLNDNFCNLVLQGADCERSAAIGSSLWDKRTPTEMVLLMHLLLQGGELVATGAGLDLLRSRDRHHSR
jgi:hypothetical protein